MRRTSLTTMYFTLSQRWLRHVLRMGAKQIPKSLLYGELFVGKRNRGRPKLRFKDVCKRKLKSLNIRTDKWESLVLKSITSHKLKLSIVNKFPMKF